ncbi:hypothetical protein F4V43_01690 [Paenibacillus spiritus]|uniref:Uncharacterized protein n=1 Tax=Paenibacillus spiritus TaxID=2496557 RepID=A0A5J5GGF6_9BACL|nr:hypothetical protein [Paenibacillus spiritus]KAA9007225.1 hypothetical protein F4V43_01690 [Paenibacillus spiritus]
MTQDKRDWQKDMDKVEVMRETRSLLSSEYQQEDPVEDVLSYWLQEAKIYKQSYEAALKHADAREQLLKEESSEAVEGLYQIIQRGDLTSFDLDQAEEVYKRIRSTLYPDTPKEAPSER